MEIRTARPEDAGDILKIYAPYVEETAISYEYEAPSFDEFAERIRETLNKYPYLVAVEDGRITGYAYASPYKTREAYRHTCEVSIYIANDCHGKGMGRALYTELERILLMQNVFVLYACVTASDREKDEYVTDDSIRFHTHMGYRIIGKHENCGYKFGRWYSTYWMEKVIKERPDDPEEFIPFPDLQKEE